MTSTESARGVTAERDAIAVSATTDEPRTLTGKRPSARSLQRHREYMDWQSSLLHPERDDVELDDSWTAFMAERRATKEKARLAAVSARRREKRQQQVAVLEPAGHAGGTRAERERARLLKVTEARRAARTAAGLVVKRGRPIDPSSQRQLHLSERGRELEAAWRHQQQDIRDAQRRAAAAKACQRAIARNVALVERFVATAPAEERLNTQERSWRSIASKYARRKHYVDRILHTKRAKAYAAKADVAVAAKAAAAAADDAERARAAAAVVASRKASERAERVLVAAVAAGATASARRRRGLRQGFWALFKSELQAAKVAYCCEEDSDYEDMPQTPEPLRPRDAACEAHARSRRFASQSPTQAWSTEGQCEGTTREGERCKVHRSSPYAVAAPLRRGERFCGHHHPDKYTGVRCASIKKHGKGQCRVWSGSCYAAAAPLCHGSPFCHHHRVRCAGMTREGVRCTVTSSSEHAHAEPLRRGEQYCLHHRPTDAAPLSPPVEYRVQATQPVGQVTPTRPEWLLAVEEQARRDCAAQCELDAHIDREHGPVRKSARPSPSAPSLTLLMSSAEQPFRDSEGELAPSILMIGQLADNIDELAGCVREHFPQLSYREVVLGRQTKCAWALPLDAQSAETGTLAECLSRLGVTFEELSLDDLDHGDNESESGSASENECDTGSDSDNSTGSDESRGF